MPEDPKPTGTPVIVSHRSTVGVRHVGRRVVPERLLARLMDRPYPVMAAHAGHMVVAADPAAFAAKYPGVTNVLGGWSGRLSNTGDAIELEDASIVGKLDDAARALGFAPQAQTLEVHGLCARCVARSR